MNSRRNVAYTLLARLATAVLSALSAVLIANELGAAYLGLFGLLRVLPATVVLLSECGIASATPYLINNQKLAAQDVLSAALGMDLLIGCLGFLVWAIAGSVLQLTFFASLDLPWVVAAGALIPLVAVEGTMTHCFRAIHRFGAANAMRWLLEACALLALGVSWCGGVLDANSLVLCLLTAHLGTSLFGVCRLHALRLTPWPCFNPSILRRAFHFGIRAQVGNSLNMLNYRMDHMILAAIADLRSLGIYMVASKAAEFFRLFTYAVTFVFESKLAREAEWAAIHTAKRLLAPTFLINACIMIVAWFLGPWLIPAVFDSWSVAATVPFQILIAGLALRGCNGVLVALNLGQGRPEINSLAVTIGFVVTLALDLALIPAWQEKGAAVASSAAQATVAMALLVSFWRTAARQSAARCAISG